MFFGLIFGSLLGPKAEYLKPVGEIFLHSIGMVIIPLIFSSVVVGITSIKDLKKLGRVGAKTLGLYLATTFVAIFIGLFFAYLFKPGMNVGFVPVQALESPGDLTGFSDMLLNAVPKNPFAAFSEGNVLQVIIFAVFLGLAIQVTGEKGNALKSFLESTADVMYSLTGIIMKFAPIGVFAVMTSVSGTFGFSILWPLAKLLGTIYLASFVQFFLVFGSILVFLCRLNPLPFFRGMAEAVVFAFSTSSSSATVPVTLHCAHKNLGVSQTIARFVIPLGSTVNMNGTAIFQGIAALFIAQMYGVELGYEKIMIIVVTATLSAIGTAGIPGAGFFILSMVLKSVGLPLEGIAIIFAVDRLRDMVGTVINIVGDAVVAVYVAKTEGELDPDRYYHDEIVVLQKNKL